MAHKPNDSLHNDVFPILYPFGSIDIDVLLQDFCQIMLVVNTESGSSAIGSTRHIATRVSKSSLQIANIWTQLEAL